MKGIKKYGFDQRSTFTSWSWKNIHQWFFSSLIYKSYKNVEKLLKKKFQKLLLRRKESWTRGQEVEFHEIEIGGQMIL